MAAWEYAIPGWNVYAAGRDAKNYFFDQPEEELKRGFDQAGRDFRAAGERGFGTEMEGLGRGLGYFDRAQGLADQQRGSLGGPSYSEQLFEQRQGGHDPYFDYMSQKGGRQLDDLFASQGGFNSGRNALAHADMLANLGAQQSQQQGALAGQADASRRGRLGQLFGQEMELGGARAGLTSGAYGRGAGYRFGGDTGAAEAGMARAGLTAQGRQRKLDFLGDLAGGGARYFGGR